MNVGLLMTPAGYLYVSLFGGLILVFLFLIWALTFLKTIFGGKDNTNLQKMYGEENEKVADAEKKKKIVGLAWFGLLVIGLAVLYYFLL